MIAIDVEGEAEIRERLLRLVPELRDRGLRSGAQAAFDTAQDGADDHTVTGALARSVELSEIDGGRGGYEVGHNPQMAPYAPFVHWGTRPHRIHRKYRKALRWPAGDKFAFAKYVDHPGYEGDAWMVRARDAAIQAINDIVNRTE